MATNPTAQAAQVAANPPTNQPVVNPQPTFALTPSKAIQGIIDYSTKFGATIWNNNTKPLSEKYNLDPKTLSGFLALVKERVEVAGWDMTIDVNGTTIDVLTHFERCLTRMLSSYHYCMILYNVGILNGICYLTP